MVEGTIYPIPLMLTSQQTSVLLFKIFITQLQDSFCFHKWLPWIAFSLVLGSTPRYHMITSSELYSLCPLTCGWSSVFPCLLNLASFQKYWSGIMQCVHLIFPHDYTGLWVNGRITHRWSVLSNTSYQGNLLTWFITDNFHLYYVVKMAYAPSVKSLFYFYLRMLFRGHDLHAGCVYSWSLLLDPLNKLKLGLYVCILTQGYR